MRIPPRAEDSHQLEAPAREAIPLVAASGWCLGVVRRAACSRGGTMPCVALPLAERAGHARRPRPAHAAWLAGERVLRGAGEQPAGGPLPVRRPGPAALVEPRVRAGDRLLA